jgi:hypothetical protein
MQILCPMYVVKRLSKSGIWSAVSLIDENGSFRGEAKFETRKQAEEYMTAYLKRMKNPQEIKVFNESPETQKKIKK